MTPKKLSTDSPPDENAFIDETVSLNETASPGNNVVSPDNVVSPVEVVNSEGDSTPLFSQTILLFPSSPLANNTSEESELKTVAETETESDHEGSNIEEPEEDRAFFSGFFDDAEAKEETLAKDFEAGLHSVFQTEEEELEEELLNEGEERSVLSKESDSKEELTAFQKEEEEARLENIDALIRQNDEDSLYELGAKYDNNDSEQAISIEEPKKAEVSPESILEAMLFVGDRQNKPLDLEKATSIMRNVSVEEAVETIGKLNERYKRCHAPYIIVQVEGGWRMVLRPEMESVRERFFGKVREFKLNQKTIDLLAIIAYRQPISAEEIADMRPGSASVLNALFKRDLIQKDKKTVDKKQVIYYRTTKRFLTIFGLESLDDLPIVEEIDYR